jgi:hypothetical protein
VSERKARRSTTSRPSIDFQQDRPQRALLDHNALAEHLRGHGFRVTGSDRQLSGCCPAHDDHHPSLRIAHRDGRTVLHCHAGCEPLAVLEAVGLHWRDLDGYPHRHGRAPQARRQTPVDRPNRVREILGCDPARIDDPPPKAPTDDDWADAWRTLRSSSPYDPRGPFA